MGGLTLEHVRAALAVEPFDALNAQRCMAPQPRSLRRSTDHPGKPRQASVLVLLYPTNTGLAFALVRRADIPGDVHSGQISLPGGSREESETRIQTALREAREEVGVPESAVQILGRLSCLYIPPSDFEVEPFVGYVPERPVWQVQTAEVVEVLECPLAWLLDETRKVSEDWQYKGRTMQVPWYNVHGHKVWGATAIILSELEQRLRCVLD